MVDFLDDDTEEAEVVDANPEDDPRTERIDVEAPAEETPEQAEEKKDRKARRAERANAHRELQEELARERAQRAAAEQRVQEYQTWQALQQQKQQQPEQQGPNHDELYNAKIAEARRMHAAAKARAAAGNWTADDEKDYYKELARIDREKNEILLDKRESMRQPAPQQRQMSDLDIYVRSQYPDIVGNQVASSWGLARLHQVRLENNGQMTKELLDQVALETREKFNTDGRAQQRRVTQKRYTGHSVANQGGNREPIGPIPVTPEERRMALEYTKDMAGKKTDKERVQIWAREVKKPIMEEDRRKAG